MNFKCLTWANRSTSYHVNIMFFFHVFDRKRDISRNILSIKKTDISRKIFLNSKTSNHLKDNPVYVDIGISEGSSHTMKFTHHKLYIRIKWKQLCLWNALDVCLFASVLCSFCAHLNAIRPCNDAPIPYIGHKADKTAFIKKKYVISLNLLRQKGSANETKTKTNIKKNKNKFVYKIFYS